MDLYRIRSLLRQRRPGHTLPQGLYNDEEVYRFDLEAIFGRSWLPVGFDVELPQAGSYIAKTIGDFPVIVLRNKRDEIVGFHNSCRHRGAQICADGRGRAPRLVCPYHQWTYDLDGGLLRAARMGEDFDPRAHGLTPIRVESVAGCIFVALSDDVPDFTPFRTSLEPRLLPHRLAEAKIAHEMLLPEQANWKLVMENGRECHHCAACHPELKTVFPLTVSEGFDFGDNAWTRELTQRLRENGMDFGVAEGDWWSVGRFALNEGAVSFSLDGKPLVSKPMVPVNGGNVGSLRWATEPNNFFHAAGDNVMMFSVLPTGPRTSEATAKWLVHKDAVEGVDYDVERLVHMWNETNLQDRALAENNQRGVNGLGYIPGPYTPVAEEKVNRFIDWYCEMAASAIDRMDADIDLRSVA